MKLFIMNNNFIYAKPLLNKAGKTASDFINYICDGKRNHNLNKYSGEEMIRIDANHGSGGKIYVDRRLEEKLNEFISL